MSIESLLIILLVGAVAGWLATLIMGQWGFGLLFNIVVGLLGGLVGAWFLPQVGIVVSGGLIGHVLTATVGAILILFAIVVLQRVGFVPRRRLR
ncbi:MAG: GlsB/YeaQ/YmgE family stress response membrane protein [Deltaproteobacteria bacterium HGW-Deltaproteobacteria-14]|jgi:uncharacterized membrane protein YeaQ/YmgE (transglycosylase-associated protein family)|nr:MAG: GlsB/YeaQ/YmgE family stress response membrane protein [Deltaproteobacteria bacterium HGW-Deltaproteobacteria-14]